MAHRLRSVPLLVGLALTVMMAAPRGVLAQACTPQYVQLREGDPTSAQVLVGCCNANGTWKTGNNTQRECLVPGNMCQRGHCDGNANSTCNPALDGTFSNAAGECVVTDNQFCKLGTCQQQLCTLDNDPDLVPLRCEDNNDCTTEGCTGSTYSASNCSHTAVTNGNACGLSPAQTCKKGSCSSGACTAVSDPGGFCGSSSGATCTPAHCDANADCVVDGPPYTCTGTLGVCKQWQCTYNGTSTSCSQAKLATGTSCDTNAHDCKIETCSAKARCTSKPQPVTTSCDTNFTTPLSDCYSGQCDARKNCENEAGGVSGYYDGVACQSDTDNCTQQTCSGLSCNVTACNGNTTACTACTAPGLCAGGSPTGDPPACGCVAQ
jgi:hypothetical protein